MELVVGDRAWSSWSMRPWLVLKHAGAAFTETAVRLRQPGTRAAILAAGSPSGQLPVLKVDGLVLWDSLAICEWAAERFPEARLWPAEAGLRALARSATAEMHAGFAALRRECPMDLTLRTSLDLSDAASDDVRRLARLWSGLRLRHGGEGPFLFGAWTIADAFFTPVATRLRSYDIDLAVHGDAGVAHDYAQALLEDPAFLEWDDGC